MNEQQLERYADVLLHIGLAFNEGEKLSINFDEAALPLVRILTEKAWELGALDVAHEFVDDRFYLSFFEKASDRAMDYHADYATEAAEKKYQQKYHELFVTTSHPGLLGNIDSERLARRMRLEAKKEQHLQKYTMQNMVKWCGAAIGSPAWANAVFPGDPDRLEKLDDAIIKACRLDRADPIAAWRAHDRQLKARESRLNAWAFDRLIYRAPGTDLTVGLVKNHRWLGGSSEYGQDVFMANIPTEEIFTMPDKYRVDGVLASTKPLITRGKMVDGITFTFKRGRVIEATAREGEATLHDVLETDHHSRYLGEVALVADDTPISQSGILFKSTLFDENASCHFALGSAYSENLPNSELLDEQAMDEVGMNHSAIHVDFMVGSDELQITGVTQEGEEIVILKDGKWVD